MTEYALAPNRKWTFASGATSPQAMLEQGLLSAYRVRENGTMRHLELYPLGSTTREAAEWISDAIDMDGRSVESVARQINVSTPTVRRFLEGLALTEEVEDGEWDDLMFDSAGNPVWSTPSEGEELVEEEEEIVRGAVVQGDPVAPKPAPAPRRTPVRRTRATQTVQEVVAKQGLPWPTDEERAAALADVPGGQCEPVGTPADEVEEALAASVAQAAPTTDRTLVACFCNDLGGHRPGGMPGCKHVAIPRRTRSHG